SRLDNVGQKIGPDPGPVSTTGILKSRRENPRVRTFGCGWYFSPCLIRAKRRRCAGKQTRRHSGIPTASLHDHRWPEGQEPSKPIAAVLAAWIERLAQAAKQIRASHPVYFGANASLRKAVTSWCAFLAAASLY